MEEQSHSDECECTECKCSKDQNKEMWSWLKHFPISAFGLPLGCASHSGTWAALIHSKKITTNSSGYHIPEILFWIAIVIMVMFSGFYIAKVLMHWNIVRIEFSNLKRRNFFFAPLLSSLMLCLITPDAYKTDAIMTGFLILLTCITLGACIYIYGEWISGDSSTSFKHAQPNYLMGIMPWFLLAVLSHSLQLVEFAIVCFSIGVFISLYGYVAIFARLANVSSIEWRDLTVLLIIAPISQAAKSLALIGAGSDSSKSIFLLAKMIIYADVFIFILLVRMKLDLFTTQLKPFASFWVITFPTNSLASVLIFFAEKDDGNLLLWILSYSISIIATISVIFALIRTVHYLACSSSPTFVDPITLM